MYWRIRCCLLYTSKEIIEKNKITMWNSVPAIIEMVVDNMPENYENSSLQHVLLSGCLLYTSTQQV